MPNSLVKSWADKYNISIDKMEQYWDSAKKYVSDHLNIKESAGDKFYKAVVGTIKTWLEKKLKEDIESTPETIESTPVENQESDIRTPDGTTTFGHPYFEVNDDIVISKILDGKQKNERWQNLLGDKKIHNWANKNYLKSFYIKNNGMFIKVR